MGASAARAQIGPLGRKRTNATNAAPAATRHANRIRPARVLGVVLGSEIIWNVKIMSAPFSSLWSGIVIGSPSQSDRPKRIAAKAAMKATLVSLRAERFTTKAPPQAMA